MGMIRGRRSRHFRPRRCPPRIVPLNLRRDSLLNDLTEAPPPEAMLPMLPFMIPAPPTVVPAPPALVTGPPSQVRQNYHASCESAINKQINLELYTSYLFLSIAFFFDRQDMELKHFATFFLWQSRKEREQAQTLMRLQNQRGGRIRLSDIRRPDRLHWESGLRAMKYALQMERVVNQSLLNLHHLATSRNDAHLCNFLEHHYLRQDVNFIKNMGASIVNLRRLGAPECGLAEYLFGKLDLRDRKKN